MDENIEASRAFFAQDNEFAGDPCILHCPYCGHNYVSVGQSLSFGGNDNYDAARVFGFGVRGHVDAILFHGQCGHSWALAFGFHKGHTYWKIVQRPDTPDSSETFS